MYPITTRAFRVQKDMDIETQLNGTLRSFGLFFLHRQVLEIKYTDKITSSLLASIKT